MVSGGGKVGKALRGVGIRVEGVRGRSELGIVKGVGRNGVVWREGVLSVGERGVGSVIANELQSALVVGEIERVVVVVVDSGSLEVWEIRVGGGVRERVIGGEWVGVKGRGRGAEGEVGEGASGAEIGRRSGTPLAMIHCYCKRGSWKKRI